MDMKTAKQVKSATLAVRVMPQLLEAIAADAAKSGWDVPDQVRFELMQNRGMWKGPVMPGSDSPKRKHS